jgi:hypothetical protein
MAKTEDIELSVGVGTFARADRIAVSYGVTHNLGDYNNIKISAEYETDIKDGEDEADAWDRAWSKVDKQVAVGLDRFESE